MNELEKERYMYYFFSPKIDRRLGGDCKATGKPSVIQKFLTKPVILDSNFFSPKMTGEGKTSGIQRVLKNFSPTSNSR